MPTANIGAPYLVTGQANKEMRHNLALAIIDIVTQARVLSDELTTPPSSPVDGDAYIVAAGGDDEWLDEDGNIAYWFTELGVWSFIVPKEGWVVYDVNQSRYLQYSGSAWVYLDPLINYAGSGAPTANDDEGDGYSVGSKWYDTTVSPIEVYLCTDATTGAAEWEQITVDASDLGTMAVQNANAVAITGGTIDGTTIGGTTPAAGAFTALDATSLGIVSTDTGNVVEITADSLTIGSGLSVASNSADTSLRSVATFLQQNAAATGALAAYFEQNAALEVVSLYQNAASSFIDFVGVEDASLTAPICTFDTPGSIIGWAQTEHNGDRCWVALYSDPTDSTA